MNDYSRDLVDIKGKKYQPVASRLRMAIDAPSEIVSRLKGSLLQSCTTTLLYNTDNYIGIKVSVQLKEEYGGGLFEGVAESDRQAKSVEGSSPIETAETSALGRALAKAGILIDLEEGKLASANEMRKATAKSAARNGTAKSIPCADCGQIIEGLTSKGKYYSPEELAAGTTAKFGRILCSECMKLEQKKTSEGAA